MEAWAQRLSTPETIYKSKFAPRTAREQPLIIGGKPVLYHQSRIEQIRQQFSGTNRYEFGLVQPEPMPASPISYLLNQRNSLRTRTWLGQRIANRAGRAYYELPTPPDDLAALNREEIRKRPDLLEGVNISPASSKEGPNRELENSLGQQAADLYTLGRVYFHEREFVKAGHQFDMLKVLEESKPRPYIAATLAAVERRDFSTAMANLIKAIELSQSLQDLLFDREAFYLKAETFSQSLQGLNQAVQRGEAGGRGGVLVAFYAMQRNDMNTAITAIESAERYTPPAPMIVSEYAPETPADRNLDAIKRLAAMLREHREQAAGAPVP